MGDGDVFDIGGLDAKLLELARERLRAFPMGGARIRRLLAVGHGGNRVGHAGVPQQPALAVLDKVAIVHEVHGLPDVDAGRPAGNVAGNALATIEDVKPLDPGLGLSVARLVGEHTYQSKTERHGDRRNSDHGHNPLCQHSPNQLGNGADDSRPGVDAGLDAIETREIDVQRTFEDFDDFWTTTLLIPVLRPTFAAMPSKDREILKARVRERLPADATGRITYEARANAVKGRKPA